MKWNLNDDFMDSIDIFYTSKWIVVKLFFNTIWIDDDAFHDVIYVFYTIPNKTIGLLKTLY